MTTATARRNPLAGREHETMTLASGNDNKMLAIARIRRDGQTQPRQGMNEDVVTDYVAALADNVRFPAVDVMFDGANYWLFDGFHRVESHLRSGRTEIEVRIHHGTLEQAQWRSYAANQSHGLRRSTADKERAIRAALQHKAAQGMSNEQVARHLGVDPKTVSKYREAMRVTLEIPESKIRTGADGRTYDVSNIGKRPNDDLREKSRKLEFWLLGKGWSFSSGPNSPNGAYKQGFPDLSWPKDDMAAGYEALRTAEKYEREAIDSQKRAEAPAATPKPSVASQVDDLAERGMDAEIETVLSGINPVDLQATEKAIHNMMADLGEALTFSITIRDGEFSIYWCAPGVPVRNALGRGETMIEAWGALVSEARESKTK